MVTIALEPALLPWHYLAGEVIITLEHETGVSSTRELQVGIIDDSHIGPETADNAKINADFLI